MYSFFKNFFSLLPRRKRRLKFSIIKSRRFVISERLIQFLLSIYFLKNTKKDDELEQVIEEAGLQITVLQYNLVQRIITTILILIVIFINYPFGDLDLWFYLQVIAVVASPFIFRPLLYTLKQYREIRITTEIHFAAKQIGVFLQGKKPLYQALTEVASLQHLPYLNKTFNLLLNEWLQDSDAALENFRKRLGTRDGQDFAAALKTLNEFPNQATIALLREREKTYKKNLRHLNDARAEGRSLIYYVITIVPFMITLITFIYPWIRESIDALQNL